MRRFLSPLFLIVVFLSSSPALAAINPSSEDLLASSIASGDGASVTLASNQILEGSLSRTDVPELERLASSLADAGYRDAAGGLLVRAAELIDNPTTDGERESIVRIASALQAVNLRSTAQTIATRGIKVTGKSQTDALNAQGFQLLGDIAFENGDLTAAAEAYASASASQSASVPTDLLVRQIKLVAKQGRIADLRALLSRLNGRLSVDGSASLLIDVAATLVNTARTELMPDALMLVEQAAPLVPVKDALQQAEIGLLRSQISEAMGKHDVALVQARGALAKAGPDGSSGLTYRLYWQIAGLQKRAGNLSAALNNYERAILKLDDVRGVLLQGSTLVFRERVLPVYQEYLDLLLARADQPTLAEDSLSKVQVTLEALNASEILDYFDDNCVLPQNTMSLTEIPRATAVVYSVTVSEKPVVLVRSASGLYRFKTGASAEALEKAALAFRESITNPSTSEAQYMSQARSLYQALLGEAGPFLKSEGVERIISVPSGYLRLIPMAALHDGESFLLNQFEWSTTLGLGLTDATPFKAKNTSAFLGGVSDAVQGFEALPGVEVELDGLESALQSRALLNERFSVADVTRRLAEGDFGIVHLATHGYFDGDHANSFLLAHDDKITLDRLQSTVGARRFSGEALDLLVLSACETAKGDERAALGLAGVSLKAGARSTLASLWPIADEATARLMRTFYEGLQAGETKSRALQLAQQSLLTDPEWAHPNYWSPYLIIGNWQ